VIRQPDPAASRAVLIGVTEYAEPRRWEALPAVRANVEDMQAMLCAPASWGLPQAHCTTLVDPRERGAVLEAIAEAAKAARDTVFVYYGGHGATTEDDLLLTLSSTNSDNLSYSAVEFAAVRRLIQGRQAMNAVIVLDCCFSGKAHAMADPESLIDTQINTTSAYILTSSARTSISLAPPGQRHTAFTGELLRVLRDGSPYAGRWLTLADMTRAVSTALADKRMPTPRYSQSGPADLLALVPNRAWTLPTVKSRPTGRSSVQRPDNHNGSMTVLGYSSLNGQDFTRERSSIPNNSSFWRTVDRLIQVDVPQPPAAVRSTGAHPIWALRALSVDGVPHWCFSVQGRGGRFGPSGMCRFGFIPMADASPSEAWAHGRIEVAGEEAKPTAPSPELVADLIGTLARYPATVAIDADPGTAAAVIEHALYVVPPKMVADYGWFTCLLQAPTMRGRVVAGRLPEDLADRLITVRRQVDDLFRRGSRGADRAVDTDALRIVASWAVGRRIPPTVHQNPAATVAELLDEVGMTLEVHQARVPNLLKTAAGQQRLLRSAENRQILREWARQEPEKAREFVAATQHGDVAVEVFDALIDLQCEANRTLEPGEGQWSHVGNFWDESVRDRLVRFLPSYAKRHGRKIGPILEELLIGSGRQPTAALLEKIRPFLLKIPVTAKDSPALWAPGPERLETLIRQGKITDATTEFAYAPDPLRWLVDAIDTRAVFTVSARDAALATIAARTLVPASRSTSPLFDAFLRAGHDPQWFADYVALLQHNKVPTNLPPNAPPWLQQICLPPQSADVGSRSLPTDLKAPPGRPTVKTRAIVDRPRPSDTRTAQPLIVPKPTKATTATIASSPTANVEPSASMASTRPGRPNQVTQAVATALLFAVALAVITIFRFLWLPFARLSGRQPLYVIPLMTIGLFITAAGMGNGLPSLLEVGIGVLSSAIVYSAICSLLNINAQLMPDERKAWARVRSWARVNVLYARGKF
jgi:hypothetical protein